MRWACSTTVRLALHRIRRALGRSTSRTGGWGRVKNLTLGQVSSDDTLEFSNLGTGGFRQLSAESFLNRGDEFFEQLLPVAHHGDQPRRNSLQPLAILPVPAQLQFEKDAWFHRAIATEKDGPPDHCYKRPTARPAIKVAQTLLRKTEVARQLIQFAATRENVCGISTESPLCTVGARLCRRERTGPLQK
jgi:hypothetical protein